MVAYSVCSSDTLTFRQYIDIYHGETKYNFDLVLVLCAASLDIGEKSMLVLIRVLHTIIWVFFVACIVAVLVFAGVNRLDMAMLFIGIVMIEVVVLALNKNQCPLRLLAERYTDDHSDGFDIYLPGWLAKHTKSIFGTLFVVGVILTAARWLFGFFRV